MDTMDREYDDIAVFIASKKTELLELFNQYEATLEKSGEYDYILMPNPNNVKTLEIYFDSGFILCFGGWHGHYDYEEDDYTDMKENIFDILNGKLYALAVVKDNKISCSALREGDVSHYSDGIQLLKEKFYSPSAFEKLTNFGGTIKVTFWDPTYSKSFDIAGKSES